MVLFGIDVFEKKCHKRELNFEKGGRINGQKDIHFKIERLC